MKEKKTKNPANFLNLDERKKNEQKIRIPSRSTLAKHDWSCSTKDHFTCTMCLFKLLQSNKSSKTENQQKIFEMRKIIFSQVAIP